MNANQHEGQPRRGAYLRAPLTALLAAAVLAAGLSIPTDTPPRTASAAGYASTTAVTRTPAVRRSRHAPAARRFGVGVVDVTAPLGAGRGEAGSGIVLDSEGLVLTNDHVVRGATELSVTDPGSGRTYPAVLLGADPDQDIAVLRVTSEATLRPARIGDSDTVRVYDEVVSVGNAGGLGYLSAAAGPVLRVGSGISSITDSGQETPLTGLIQARSNIRPGDSGGAMLNIRGQVIAINVAYAMTPGTRSPSGVGYAIPINHALCVAEHLVTVTEEQND